MKVSLSCTGGSALPLSGTGRPLPTGLPVNLVSRAVSVLWPGGVQVEGSPPPRLARLN